MNNRQSIGKDLEAPLLERNDSQSDIEIDVKKSSDVADENDRAAPTGTNQCAFFNLIYCYGFAMGVVFQSLSLYANGSFAALFQNGNRSIPVTVQRPGVSHPIFIISQYLLLPPIMTIMVQKYRLWKSPRKGNGVSASVIRSNMESFLECARFQVGMLMGSLCQVGLLFLLFVTMHAPPGMLLAFYAVWFVASLFAICVFQTCVNQTCAHIKSVELNIHCDKDEEARE